MGTQAQSFNVLTNTALAALHELVHVLCSRQVRFRRLAHVRDLYTIRQARVLVRKVRGGHNVTLMLQGDTVGVLACLASEGGGAKHLAGAPTTTIALLGGGRGGKPVARFPRTFHSNGRMDGPTKIAQYNQYTNSI